MRSCVAELSLRCFIYMMKFWCHKFWLIVLLHLRCTQPIMVLDQLQSLKKKKKVISNSLKLCQWLCVCVIDDWYYYVIIYKFQKKT